MITFRDKQQDSNYTKEFGRPKLYIYSALILIHLTYFHQLFWLKETHRQVREMPTRCSISFPFSGNWVTYATFDTASLSWCYGEPIHTTPWWGNACLTKLWICTNIWHRINCFYGIHSQSQKRVNPRAHPMWLR